MKKIKNYNVIPKHVIILAIVIFVGICTCGVIFFTGQKAKSDEAILIYLNNDLENQEVGETPHGVWFAGDDSLIRIENVPADRDEHNKAVGLFYASGDEKAYMIDFLSYMPIQDNFILSFSFMTSDTTTQKLVEMRYDAVEDRHSRYDESAGLFNLLEISDVINVNGNSVFRGVKANTWYDVDIVFDMDADTAAVYVNDKLKEKSIALPEMVNAASFRFACPDTENDKWYVDNLKTYVANKRLSDKEFAFWVKEYENADVTPNMKYELSRAFQYDKFIFAAFYNRFVAMVDGINFYKDNLFYPLSTPIYEEEGTLFVPAHDLAEAFGGTASWDEGSQKLTLNYKRKKLEITLGEEQYYIDGKGMPLSNAPALNNGTLCMPITPVMDFFEVTYTREDDFIYIGSEMYCPWDLGPMRRNSFARTLKEEILHRLQVYLLFDLPTSEEEILHAYEQNHADDSQPKLLIHDFEEIKKKADGDPIVAELVSDLLVNAERVYDNEIIAYTLRDGKRSDFAGSMQNSAYYLAFAYKMTGEERYKDRLWEDLEAASTFPDFNPGHALDMGYMSHAVAIAYNWLYDDWTSEQKEIIEEMIRTKVLEPFVSGYRSPIYGGFGVRSYGKNASNQEIVVNTGLLSSALVMMEQEPEICSELIRIIIKSCSRAILGFYPDGSWEEGISYWQLTMGYMPHLITNLQEHLGSDFGFTTCPGVAETFYFPFAYEGGEGSFLLGDASNATNAEHPSMMWWSKQSGDMEFASLCLEAGLNSLMDLIYYVDIQDYTANKSEIQNDFYYSKEETVFMRNGWGDSDTYLVFHGGENDAAHGHVDNGTFQFDMIGERWACEVPKEDYNLAQFGSYIAGGASNPYKDGYYRNIAEGHNTVVADIANNRFGQNTKAVSPIIEYDFSDSMSYAIMDLTDTNDLYSSALRGVKFNKITSEIVVQDEFKSTAATEFWWFMHTQADIVLSADRKTATLTLNGKSITASIISSGNEVFQILPAERLKGYGENAPLESSNDGYRKLAIQKKDSDIFNVAVSFQQMRTSDADVRIEEEYLLLEDWEATETERAELEKVYVDKVPFANFDPYTYNYIIETKTEKSPIPEIFAVEKGDCKVDIVEAATLPGITTIYLSRENEVVGQYNFIFTPLNYTSMMLSENQIPIAGFTVTSEPQPDNAAVNLFDLNLETKYATDEIGGGVTVDFGEAVELYEVKLGFLNGAKRKEFFKIFVSEDGENYTEVLDGVSSGTTTDYQSFIVGPVTTRYMKVLFYGNEKSSWVSISELIAFTQ